MSETVAFYTALGLAFQSEQHGTGPKHYCCQLDALALEIYPSKGGDINGSVMVGIKADDLDSLKLPLNNIVAQTAPFGDGRRVIVTDPDGRNVFVFEAGQA
ncbi:VOC family protein [Profundibacter sp.]|uniref:VOC family protein n=1 Tax=Profundibacter sp. TaxID=3101071 RepID=UPI003D0CB940